LFAIGVVFTEYKLAEFEPIALSFTKKAKEQLELRLFASGDSVERTVREMLIRCKESLFYIAKQKIARKEVDEAMEILLIIQSFESNLKLSELYTEKAPAEKDTSKATTLLIQVLFDDTIVLSCARLTSLTRRELRSAIARLRLRRRKRRPRPRPRSRSYSTS